MGKVKKFILITFLSIIAITFLISAYYLATYDLPAPVDKRAIVKEKALNYLKDRYGEEFEVVNVIDPEPYHNFYKISAFHKNEEHDRDHEITLHGWVTKGAKKLRKRENDKITFYDNYAAIKIIPELKKQVSDLILKNYSDCKIHISFHREWIQNNVDLYYSAREFLKEDTYWKQTMSISIFTLDEKINEKKRMINYCEKVFEQMSDENFQGSASIYFYNEKYYRKINDPQVVNNNATDMTFLSATCGKDFVYSRCDFKQNGKFNIDFRDK